MTTYIAVRFDGSHTIHTSLSALRRAADRAAGPRVIVDHWPADDPPPFGSPSAADWDQYRTRRGYVGD